MKNSIITFFIGMAVLATSPAFAQILIEGTVKDQDTKEGLPFAHVYVEGTTTVTVSDIDGIFVINVPQAEVKNKLVISVVGYENYEQTPREIQAKQTTEFLLKAAVFDLELAVVQAPEKILRDALSKIDENYWTEPFMVEGFYRKGALENNKFVYLTEAIIQYHNKGYHKKDNSSIDINILQLRNSEDFRDVKIIQHWNPIYNTLYNLDKVKNRHIHTALKETKMGSATMEVSVYNGEDIYIIKLGGLTMYIGSDNHKIYRLDSPAGKNDTGSSFQYRAYKGKLYPFYIRIKRFSKDGKKTAKHMITEYRGRNVRNEAFVEAELAVEEETLDNPNIELGRILKMVDNKTKQIMVEKSQKILKETDLDLIGFIQEFVATDVSIRSEKKYKINTNLVVNQDLFETEVFYDNDFWNNLQLPNKSKFLQKIKADLEEAGNGKTLDQQYEEMGKINNESNKKFLKRLKKGRKSQ